MSLSVLGAKVMEPSTAWFIFITIVAVLLSAYLRNEPLSGALFEHHYSHRRIGVTKSNSYLKHQFSRPHHQPRPDQPARLQSLYIYPVKSCRGIELSRSRVLATGLEFDRLYSFAQLREDNGSEPDADGKREKMWAFVTQRQAPLLANVKVELWIPKSEGDSGTNKKRAYLAVRFPWRDAGIMGIAQWLSAKIQRGWSGKAETSFNLPIDFPLPQEIESNGYEFAEVKIWNEVTTALNMIRCAPPELQTYLGIKNQLGLFRFDPSRRREVFRCAPTKEEAGYQPIVDFHDAYPLHLISLTSLQDLESMIEKDDILRELDVRRFRANMIISGAEAYDEEAWKAIGFDGQDANLFHVSCRTVRCNMLNVDPSNGVRHRFEPDRSLRKYRDVDEGAPKWGCLGMQLCPMFRDAQDPDNRESVLEVGMEISVLKRGHHVYIPQ